MVKSSGSEPGVSGFESREAHQRGVTMKIEFTRDLARSLTEKFGKTVAKKVMLDAAEVAIDFAMNEKILDAELDIIAHSRPREWYVKAPE